MAKVKPYWKSSNIFANIDASKFKENIKPETVFKMLLWMTDGFMNQFPDHKLIDSDDIWSEFNECINFMKANFYKSETSADNKEEQAYEKNHSGQRVIKAIDHVAAPSTTQTPLQMVAV